MPSRTTTRPPWRAMTEFAASTMSSSSTPTTSRLWWSCTQVEATAPSLRHTPERRAVPERPRCWWRSKTRASARSPIPFQSMRPSFTESSRTSSKKGFFCLSSQSSRILRRNLRHLQDRRFPGNPHNGLRLCRLDSGCGFGSFKLMAMTDRLRKQGFRIPVSFICHSTVSFSSILLKLSLDSSTERPYH